MIDNAIVGLIGTCIQSDVLDFFSTCPSETFDLIIADPPFNTGKVYGGGIDDSRPVVEYRDWCREWIRESFRVLKTTGSFYIYINSRHLGHFQVIGEDYGIWRNTIVWHYTNPTPAGKSYPKTWSGFLFFTKGDQYTFNKDAAQMRRFHTNPNVVYDSSLTTRLYDVWSDVSKLVEGYLAQPECLRLPDSKKRSCLYQLPQEIIKRLVLTSSNPGDLVLDLFAHSGTTSKVCQDFDRLSIGVELVPAYVDIVNDRLGKNRL